MGNPGDVRGEPSEAPLLNHLELSLKALADTSVLSKGGLAGYGIYVVAVLVALFLVVWAVAGTAAALLPQLILVSGLLLATGLAAAALTSYLKFRRAALAAELETEALRLRVELVKQRGSLVGNLLASLASHDVSGFREALKSGSLKDFVESLDRNYAALGVGDKVLSGLLEAHAGD